MDEKAPFYCQLDLELQHAMFWNNFFHSFARIGAPVDLLMLSDLEKADLSQYKVLFFPTCLALTEADRQRIEELKCNQRTLVFFQADGYIDPQSGDPFSLKRMAQLTGMTIQLFTNYGHCHYVLSTSSDHPLMENFTDRSFGAGGEKSLVFYVKDVEVEPLAYFNGRGAVGMARKIFTGWTSIYCAVPELAPHLVYNILRSAGVHIYVSDREDIVYACKDYVGIYTRAGGSKTLSLPQTCRVIERYHKAVETQEKTQTITWEAQSYTAYLFELE